MGPVAPAVVGPAGPAGQAVAALAGPAALALAGPAALALVDLMVVVQVDPADVDLMDPVVAPVGLAARVMTEALVANAAPAARMEDAAPVGLPTRRGSWSMRWNSMRTEMAC